MIIVSNFDNLIGILYTCAILVNFIPNFILCTLQPLKIIKKTRIHENYKETSGVPHLLHRHSCCRSRWLWSGALPSFPRVEKFYSAIKLFWRLKLRERLFRKYFTLHFISNGRAWSGPCMNIERNLISVIIFLLFCLGRKGIACIIK